MSRIIRSSQVAPAVVVTPPAPRRDLPLGAADRQPADEPPGPSEAERLLLQAQALIAQAQSEAAEIRQAAAEAGRSEGYQDALAAVHRELAETVGAIGSLAQQARLAQDDILRNVERDVVELALAVAQKVIAAELTVRPDVVREVVASALRELELSSVVRVRVHPDDARAIASWWSDFLSEAQRATVQLVPDSQVAPGGCIVDTQTGVVDSQIWSRFDQVSAALLHAAEPARPAAPE